MIYPAHVRCGPDGCSCTQTVEEHCRNTARYASDLKTAGLGHTAFLAGLLHDAGKFTMTFQNYITRAAAGETVRRGSVNHTFAGVRLALERWHAPTCVSYRDMACELIAFAIGAHHGLFDCIGPEGKDGFLHRMTDDHICYEEAGENFLAHCAGWDELDGLFDTAAEEVTAAVGRCKQYVTSEPELRFLISLMARLLLSAVIDADRRDTAEFMCGRLFPQQDADMRACWKNRLAAVEKRLLEMPADTPINQARRAISDRCRASAGRSGGIYRLSVPTGGGKTLATLRYALAAAAQHKKSRIFFVVPLLSVLEQNAAVIRDYLNDDSLILEHHSNVVRTENSSGELDTNELLTETWDSPVVLTTLVQLLNTLFAGQTTCIRRMKALTNSVIIIDEVQSVPRRMLSQFNLALNFLTEVCGAAIVLCSATQPCLEAVDHALRYAEPPELVPCDPALWATFRRTEIMDRRRPEGYTTEELAEFVLEIMRREDSLLLICNTKAEAKMLYRALRGADARVFHLSTAMCMAHRIRTLKDIRSCLEQSLRVICVSTQLVEAGVDFSFACVIRVSAGMDNVVQAAGRCNRSGEFGRLCAVYIVNIRGENLSRLKEIRESQLASESLLVSFARDSAAFGGDPASDASIRAYYHRLFADMPRGAQDYPLPEYGTTLFELLSDNRAFGFHCPTYGTHIVAQAFQTAGSRFCVFEDNTVDVLVPHGDGIELLSDLRSARAQHDLNYRRELLKQAKGFSISLYDYEVKRLAESEGLSGLCGNTILALSPAFYHEEMGFEPEGNYDQFLEVSDATQKPGGI